ncbi:transcriptional regulator [Izhakiella australiensis]|uniref:Transcriptional regulator n=1 Tax=Izhakiella australiensis TaxID=1926881 RepID=A0A1S8YSA5_9GAMM|nr:sigma-54 dependent transcriptional regulator [Izhakiella australiensis]OON41755.1 transcriptional regulator [Izhakiella australiensis]
MLTNQHNILLIDDDSDVLDAYTLLLAQAGHRVFACRDPRQAQTLIGEAWAGIVLSDVCMPYCSGIELMKILLKQDPTLPVLLVTGHGDVPMAVEAVKKGAWDFLQKPVNPEQLLNLVDKALAQRQARLVRRQWQQEQLADNLIGRSEWVSQMRQTLRQLAETDITVYFHGESGSGRTLAACYLHRLSARSEQPVIFGDVVEDQEAPLNQWIEQAAGGMLVLRNIERLTQAQQYLLAHSQSQDPLPFRLVAIGQQPPLALAGTHRIIPELYYCFALTQLFCPPLSQRPDDIEPLFRHYLQQASQRLNNPPPALPPDLCKKLLKRHWPNNVRELANAARLFAVGVMPLADTPTPLLHSGEPLQLDRRVEEYERQIIVEALNIHQGRINDVAEYLQIPRKKLYLRMKKFDLDKHHYR